MWENVKERNLAFWQLHVSKDMDRSVTSFLKSPSGRQYRSRSNLIQCAVEEKLAKDASLLKQSVEHDPLRLSQDLPARKAEERTRAKRHVRWCIVLDRHVDRQLRSFLAKYGARHGAQCRYVDDALTELISQPDGALLSA